ncbi:hypothetical protein [Streptomyces sp. NPDC056242]|uniref:hypothetical protein n=1 Tax=Streptomyces sp. NPDC056242 TaxID=3345760 RepID=UPI0035E34E2F
MVAGRSNEGRSVTVGTTNASTALTGAAGTFHEEDAGRTITGTGIPAAATIASVTSDTAAVLSAAASATGSPSVTLGRAQPQAYGFGGWSPETDAESETYSVAAVNAGTATPDRLTNTYTRVEQRARG